MKAANALTLMGTVALIVGLQSAAITPNLALFANMRIGMTEGETAAFLATFHISALVFSLAIPHFTDMFGWRKAWVVGAIFLTSAAALLLAFVDGFRGALLVAVGLLGPAASSIGLYFAYLRSTEYGRDRVVSMRSVFSVAWVAGPAGASFLIDWAGFGGLLVAVALCGLPILFLAPFLPTAVSTSQSSFPGSDHQEPSNMWIMVIAFVLLQATNAVIVMATPLIITESLKLPVTYAGILFSVTAAMEIPLFLLLGHVSRKRSPKTIVVIGSIGGLLYYSSMYIFSSYLLLLVVQVLNAVFIVSIMGAGMAWFQATMPKRVGLATGLYMNTSRVGALIGTPSALMLVGAYGGDFKIAALFAAGLTLLALTLLFLPLPFYTFRKRVT